MQLRKTPSKTDRAFYLLNVTDLDLIFVTPIIWRRAAREGGMHVPFFALWVPSYYHGAEAVRRTLDLRDAIQRVVDKYPDQIELATSAHDVERIVGEKKIAAILTAEGGHQIDDDLAVLRMYRRMEILSMTLTHTRNNHWAGSSTDKPEHDGLTEFGKQVVREMNRIGMIVDVSHVSDKTFYDVLQVSTKPVGVLGWLHP